MKFCVLASGSAENATYVEQGGMRLLIDVGPSCRKLTNRLTALGVNPAELDGILITHEHADHVKGMANFCKKYAIPVYANEGTASVIERNCYAQKEPLPEFVIFQTQIPFSFGDLTITPVPVSHDTAEPVGYTLDDGTCRFGYFTDLGHYSEQTVQAIRDCTALILESNHDIQMLEHSARPYSLISRIRGPVGHLSNDDACRLIAEAAPERLRALVLAHLSHECNLPDLAETMMRATLKEIGRDDLISSLYIAKQNEALPLIEL